VPTYITGVINTIIDQDGFLKVHMHLKHKAPDGMFETMPGTVQVVFRDATCILIHG